MRRSDFRYELPDELIAQHPAAPQRQPPAAPAGPGAARWQTGPMLDLPRLLRPGDLLVFNDTRVIKARLFGARTPAGESSAGRARAGRARAARAARRQQDAAGRAPHRVRRRRRLTACWGATTTCSRLRFEGDGIDAGVPAARRRLPLPPYIEHAPDDDDAERYQTVFAREPGAVAAPTAGLHFDDALLARAARARRRSSRYADAARRRRHLPAGARRRPRASTGCTPSGTSVPQATGRRVRAARARRRARRRGRHDGLRALESAARAGSWRPAAAKRGSSSRPAIVPASSTRLITNFHLPKSTLLMLVSAFAGLRAIIAAYRHAVDAALPLLQLRRRDADRSPLMITGGPKYFCRNGS